VEDLRQLRNGSNKPPADEGFAFPCTVAQQAFWYLDQLEPGNPAYNIAVRFGLRGPLMVSALERAFNDLIARHESLRTVFETVDGQPVEVVVPEMSIRLPVDDLRHIPVAARPARADALAIEEARVSFDLFTGPLIRTRLLRLDDEDYVLLVTVHHIISDGWSIGIISREVGTLYDAHCGGISRPLPDLPLQYADFAVWQNDWLKSNQLADQLSYWVRQLADLPLLELPTDRPRPAILTSNGYIESILLPRILTDRLQSLSTEQGSTFFMLALAALTILLQRRSGRDDIFVGSLVAGRSQAELEQLIGVFINTVVLRTDLSGDPTFVGLLERVRETVLEALANQEVPFERIVEKLRPRRDRSRHPLFQINFIFQRDFVEPLEVSGVKLTAIPSKSPGAIYDLNFFMVERPDGWRASCEYNTDLYDAGTVTHMLAQFQAILEGIAANPESRVSGIPMLTAVERERLLLGSTHSQQMQRPTIGQPRLGPQDDIEAKLATIWRQVLGVGEISTTTDFFDAGGHSLLAARLISQVEKAFGRRLSLASLLQAPTIEAFARRLREETAGARRDQVFPIQPKGSRTPLFVLTSQPAFFYRLLSRRLGAEQPMLGLAWPELAALPANFSVRDIAANVIEALRDVRPHGPYYLGGWCMSGVIVYEMAQQLRASGEVVELLVLFDANNPSYVRGFRGLKALPKRAYLRCQKLAYKVGKVARKGPAGALSYILQRIRRTFGKALRHWHTDNDQTAGFDPRQSMELQSRVAAGYEPDPYGAPIVLFRSAAYQTGRFRDLTLGWGKLAQGELDVHEIPGEHHDMFLEPHVDLLAEKLRSYLPQIPEDQPPRYLQYSAAR
jgi:thioesterase domain-containing protein/acyl carrier protein